MPANSVFKNILVPADIEEAAINTLKTWMPTYIRGIESMKDMEVGAIKPPLLYTNRNSFDINAGEKLPRIVCISPGLADTPRTKGDGQYIASWRLGVGVATASHDEQTANLRVKIMGAAVRAVLTQKASLGGIAQSTRWTDESYDDLPFPTQNQHLKAAGIYFVVECEDVVTRYGGPAIPDDEPYAYGTAEEVIVELVKVDINA